MEEIGLVAPTPAIARFCRSRLSARLRGTRGIPLSLAEFLANARAPRRIVVCPGGRSVARDLVFLRRLSRRALWPPPQAELAGAIAGLRGSHDAVPQRESPSRAGRGRESAFLLENEVTLARARMAASSGVPREWIVERAQSVRIGAASLRELERLGVKWSVLEPVEVVALAASPALAKARPRWSRWLPADVTVWMVPASK